MCVWCICGGCVVCVYACVSVCKCVCVCLCVFMCVCGCVCVSTRVRARACLCVCLFAFFLCVGGHEDKTKNRSKETSLTFENVIVHKK